MALEGTPQAPTGVHQATLVAAKSEMVEIDKWPYPKLHVEFQLADGQKAIWSEDVGFDIFYMIRSLTGKSLPTNIFDQDNNAVFRAAIQALHGQTWSGLVRVNLRGYVDQVAFHPGSYTWRFLGLATRNDGVPCDIEGTDKKTGEIFRWIKWHAEVVAGPCSGYRHTQWMRLTTYSVLPSGNLSTSTRGKLWRLIENITGDVAWQHQPGCENIWPVLEGAALQAAENGLLYTANAHSLEPIKSDGKKNWNVGDIDWETILKAHPSTISGDILPVTAWDTSTAQQPAPVAIVSDPSTNERVNGQVVAQLNTIKKKLGLEGEFTGEVRDNGTTQDFEIPAWATLYPSFVEHVCAILPLPSPYGWPPMTVTSMNWGEDAASQFVEILLHFANMPNAQLEELMLDVDAMNQELQDVFVSPAPVPAAVAQMGAPAAAAMMGGTEEDEEEEVEEDAIPF